jgi:ApaG protein
MYNRTTRNIRIHVQPQFLEGQSRPDEAKFVWAYTITVENQGAEIVTLLSRYWKITDAFGRIQEVRGDGVVGEQPTLKPGENFQYTSGCPLSTPNGFMVGSYHMKNQHGETFEV